MRKKEKGAGERQKMVLGGKGREGEKRIDGKWEKAKKKKKAKRNDRWRGGGGGWGLALVTCYPRLLQVLYAWNVIPRAMYILILFWLLWYGIWNSGRQLKAEWAYGGDWGRTSKNSVVPLVSQDAQGTEGGSWWLGLPLGLSPPHNVPGLFLHRET